MLNLFFAVLGITLLALVVTGGVNYINPDTGRRSISIVQVDQEATSLMLAWNSHYAATGTPPLTMQRLDRFRPGARQTAVPGLQWDVDADGICAHFSSTEEGGNATLRATLEGFAKVVDARHVGANAHVRTISGPNCDVEEATEAVDGGGFAVQIRMNPDA